MVIIGVTARSPSGIGLTIAHPPSRHLCTTVGPGPQGPAKRTSVNLQGAILLVNTVTWPSDSGCEQLLDERTGHLDEELERHPVRGLRVQDPQSMLASLQLDVAPPTGWLMFSIVLDHHCAVD